MPLSVTTVATCPAAIDAITFAPDGTPITAARDGVIRGHGANPVDILRTEEGHFHLLAAGRQLVAGGTSGQLVWLDSSTHRETRRITAMEDGLTCLAVREDGLVAVGGDDCTLKLYAPGGACTWVGETYKWPYAATFSPDGRRLLVASWDAYLYPVDLDALEPGTEDEPHRLPYPHNPWHDMPIMDVHYLQDGRVATATAGDDARSVRIYTPGEKEVSASVTCEAINALAVSPDGASIAGGGNDQSLYLWNAADLSEKARLVLGTETLAPERKPDRWFPAYAEFHEASGPDAIFALAFDPSGDSLWVGTQRGKLLRVRA